MLNSRFLNLPLGLIIVLVFLGSANTALSEDTDGSNIPTRYGLAAVFGKTFDPVDNIYFTQLSGFIMWDYDKVWHHWAPDPLRFKVEGTAGLTVSPNIRAMVSVGMMALYYLEFIASDRLVPYLEGGIGAVYTDFQVEGQGSRFNFNPQIGIGVEFKVNSGKPFFTALRLSHISNAGLQDENRGVNSVVWMLGRFF
jgi:lipid A 3-O-deacylase